MFYTFDQNNSGGSFHYDKNRGITEYVIVEAKDAQEANDKAERIGLYFDGSGDCPCCGDRWSNQYSDSEGTKKPEVYGKSAKDKRSMWDEEGIGPVAVHYANGKIKFFGRKE